MECISTLSGELSLLLHLNFFGVITLQIDRSILDQHVSQG